MPLHTAKEIARRVAEMGVAGHAHDCVTDPVDGYCQNAESVQKDWGLLPAPEMKAAYVLACAQLHAAQIHAEALDRQTRALLRIADGPLTKMASAAVGTAHQLVDLARAVAGVAHAHEQQAGAIERLACNTFRQAESMDSMAAVIDRQLGAVSAAIEVHSESIDRLADAVETRAP